MSSQVLGLSNIHVPLLCRFCILGYFPRTVGGVAFQTTSNATAIRSSEGRTWMGALHCSSLLRKRSYCDWIHLYASTGSATPKSERSREPLLSPLGLFSDGPQVKAIGSIHTFLSEYIVLATFYLCWAISSAGHLVGIISTIRYRRRDACSPGGFSTFYDIGGGRVVNEYGLADAAGTTKIINPSRYASVFTFYFHFRVFIQRRKQGVSFPLTYCT